VVRAARYAPLGLRGMGGLGPATDFESAKDRAAQMAFANAQVHVTVMLESAEAFRHIDEIVGMAGIDAVSLGPTDLAQELGVFGTPDQARVIDEHREQMIAAARKHGKDVAMFVTSLDEGERWIQRGAKIIIYSDEVEVLKSGYTAAVQRLRPART